MFPPKFARENILAFTRPGDVVLDPFCGRGTSVLESLLQDREGIGSDINPVAVVVSQAKSDVPRLPIVLRRLRELETILASLPRCTFDPGTFFLPPFFKHAFHPETLKQILFFRTFLEWRTRSVDRFICALALGHLHGESDDSPSYLSNQMSHTIAMKPRYATEYWARHGSRAPWRDAFDLLCTKARYRLEEAKPQRTGTVLRSDARKCSAGFADFAGRVSAVITSPPYLDVTRFEEDQWLRLWFLGGPPEPTYGRISPDDRHTSRDLYFRFLSDVWCGVKPLLRARAHLVCRIGTRHISFDEMSVRLAASVKSVWPKSRLVGHVISGLRNKQTSIILPRAAGCESEYDFTFCIAA
jgi:hypothetical protein